LITVPDSNCRLFSDINISQGSVTTHLRCGGIYSYQFTANLLQTLTVKEFWKSVKIWQSYWYKFTATFFMFHRVRCWCVSGFLLFCRYFTCMFCWLIADKKIRNTFSFFKLVSPVFLR